MRILALLILATGMLSAAGPAQAQAWDPNYPVCMQVYGPITYNDCRYTSIAQCAASAAGRGAQCSANPYFSNAYDQPGGRTTRQRRAY